MGMNYVITGGLGFIGLNLVLKIIQNNNFNTISIIDNETATISFNKNYLFKLLANQKELKNKIKIYNFKFDNETILKNIIKSSDVLVHLAASAGVIESIKDPVTNFKENVVSTLSLLNFIKELKNLKVIVASSGAVLGDAPPPFNEKTNISPISPYGASKASIEQYCRAFAYTYGLNIICCRFSNVYGPFSLHKKTVVRKMYKTSVTKKEINITGNGRQTRDFLYVEDLIDALILIALNKKIINFDLINISTSKETSILNMAHEVKKIIENHKGYIIKLKFSEGVLGEVLKSYSDYKHLKKITYWTPKTSLKNGLKKTISWFEQNT